MYATQETLERVMQRFGHATQENTVYSTLTQRELDELMSASTAPTSMIEVRINAQRNTLELRLTKIVATTNYKVLARLGRHVGCKFDASIKTTSIGLRNMEGFTTRGKLLYGYADPLVSDDQGSVFEREWDDAAMVLALPVAEKEGMMKLVRRLAGTRAKRYKTTEAAAAERQVKAERTRQAMARRVYVEDEYDFESFGPRHWCNY